MTPFPSITVPPLWLTPTTIWHSQPKRPYARRRPYFLPEGATAGFTGMDLGPVYNLPTGLTGAVPTVWITELGGGYSTSKLQSWCNSRGFPYPNIAAIGIDGAQNAPGGEADGEVEGDIAVVIGVIYFMFRQAANIRVLFAPNSDTGFLHAEQYIAINAKAGDTSPRSWGGPENQYSASILQQMEGAYQTMDHAGVSATAASGDNGPDDGTGSPTCDYPGVSAWVTDCGATTTQTNPLREVPWNSGGGASGGGRSAIIAFPSWQAGVAPAGVGRCEPDVCAAGDPSTGWDTPNGEVGGTSMDAPYYAAVFAGINAALLAAGRPVLGFANPKLYAAPASCFFDVVQGGIGGGDNAGPGYDLASGRGSLNVGAFLAWLMTGATTPPPPTNPPPPIQPPAPPAVTEAQVLATLANVTTALDQRYPAYRNVWNYQYGQMVAALRKLYGG